MLAAAEEVKTMQPFSFLSICDQEQRFWRVERWKQQDARLVDTIVSLTKPYQLHAEMVSNYSRACRVALYICQEIFYIPASKTNLYGLVQE